MSGAGQAADAGAGAGEGADRGGEGDALANADKGMADLGGGDADKGGGKLGGGDADKGGGKLGEQQLEKKPGDTPAAYYPGDLPDDMKGKTDRETIDNLAKRAKGLRDALAKKPGAAGTSEEDYKLELPKEMAEKFDITNAADAPILKAAQKAALKNGIPKDMYNGFVGEIISDLVESGVLKNAEPQTPEQLKAKAQENAETELGKLAKTMGGRDKALALVREERAWLDQQHKLGILTASETAELYTVFGTAEGFNAWQKMRRLFTGHEIPAGSGEPIAGVMSVKEARQLYRDPKYQTDPAFRENAEKQLAAAVRANKGRRA